MAIKDKRAAGRDEITCDDVEDTRQLINAVLTVVMEPLLERAAVSNAYTLLRRGQLAGSEAFFSGFMGRLQSAIELWRTRGQELIGRHLEHDPPRMFVNLTLHQKTSIQEQAFEIGLIRLEAGLAQTRTTLAEIRDDIKKWGSQKSVEVRYQELLEQKRSYWIRAFKRVAAAVILAICLASGSYRYSFWLMLLIGILCLVFVACFLFSASWQAGKSGWGENWGDQELADFARERHKR